MSSDGLTTHHDSYHRNAARQINAILAAGKENGAKPNYSAISDIFRILILDIEGGFYNDTDNYIFESTGPMGELRVTKALGYKILVMFRNVGDVNVSCINGSMIASLPKSKLTRAALMKIEIHIYNTGKAPRGKSPPDSLVSRVSASKLVW